MFVAGRALFKRWVEGPEVTADNSPWPDRKR
jgi:hypothetical protein